MNSYTIPKTIVIEVDDGREVRWSGGEYGDWYTAG